MKYNSSSIALIGEHVAQRDQLLRNIPDALDQQSAGMALSRALSRARGGLVDVDVRSVRVLRLKAGRRCLLEYEAELRGAPGGQCESLTILGKIRRRGVAEETVRLTRALSAAGFKASSADGISVPEVLGTVPEWGMWLQRKVPGVPLTDRIACDEGVVLARRAADAACKLHSAAVRTSRQHTPDDEIRILRERLLSMARVEPGRRTRLIRILSACERIGATLPSAAPRFIHRDFYPDQVIVDNERLHLLDLDLACLGDPALDAGNFIAHLTEHALRFLGDGAALAEHEAAFVERFVELSPAVSRSAIEAYAALTIARLVSISPYLPGRAHTTDALLDTCEMRLAMSGAQP